MPALGPSHSHPHALASEGYCGFLALRELPPQVREEERVVRELAQLLDVPNIYTEEVVEGYIDFPRYASGDCKEYVNISTISERFIGMKATMVTNSSIASAFGKKAGFSVTALNEFRNKKGSSEESEDPPDPHLAASELLSLLGLQEAVVEETSRFDLVFIHIVPTQKAKEAGNYDNYINLANGLEWINALVDRIMDIAECGTEVTNHLYLTLILSYGIISSDKTDDSSPLLSSEEVIPSLASLFPRQSYTMKGGKLLDDVRHHHPMLVVQRQEAVTRRDRAKIFSFEEFREAWLGSALPPSLGGGYNSILCFGIYLLYFLCTFHW